MNVQNGALASAGSACPEKATELFYVTHPKVEKPLLGPFLSRGDAEFGRTVLRSSDAVVMARPVKAIDEMTYWHAVNNGQVCRAFAGADRQGGAHE